MILMRKNLNLESAVFALNEKSKMFKKVKMMIKTLVKTLAQMMSKKRLE